MSGDGSTWNRQETVLDRVDPGPPPPICGEWVHLYQMGGYACTKPPGHDGGHDNPAFWEAV